MTSLSRKLAAAAVAVAALAAAGCGGDDYSDSQPAVTDSVPASASQSIGGFIEYLMKLVVAAADMLDPVDVSGVVAPTDEVSDPVPLT